MNHPMRIVWTLAACTALAGAALAQNTNQNSPQPKQVLREQLPKQEQKPAPGEPKVQRIRVEDAGSRIDELRVGGETQSIDVQPKANVPAYQVSPDAGGRAGPAQRDAAPSAQGARTWKILSF
jgi:hypothetical protein